MTKEANAKFDRLLQAMATQPEPSEKQQADNQTSDKASGAGYGDTRTREGKSEVLLRNVHVSPVDAAFHVRPKAFDIVRVNVAAHVFFCGVIDRFMFVAVLFGQQFERRTFVRVDFCSRLHVGHDMRNDVRLGAHLDVASENVAVALDDAEHDGLVIVPRLVLAADKSFVDFDRLAGTAKRIVAVNVAHVFADQIAHPPRGFVGHAKLALHLFRGHAVPGSA